LPDERFYGCGEKTGQLNKRGEQFSNWNTDNPSHTFLNGELYVSIPFLISSAGGARCYGLFFDNCHRTTFNLGRTTDETHYWLEADAGELDYYFIAGGSLQDIVRRYTDLTGRMTLPPRWALGYQQCRWSYLSADEVLEVAGEFRKRKIPADVMYCDIDYMDGYRVFTWNPKTFPQPKELTAKLQKLGFQLVTIIDPGVKNDDQYAVCREGKEQGMFVKTTEGKWFTGNVWPGECVFPDFTSARVRQWWGKWQQTLLETGVAGFWNDMNEPAVWIDKLGTMPGDVRHEFEGQWVPHARAHNVYGLTMARASFEGYRAARPDTRPFIITRSAYAGVQRYAMVWTGDNHSTWEEFALSIRQCLNLSLSGVAFCGPDVGGFSWDCHGELFARWVQAGAFFPFFRNHTAHHTRRQEPWTFGPEVEAIARKYITLRYTLLPYLYNLFYEASQTGAPILRPLFWEFPADAAGYAIDDQFLLGPSLLVAPILRHGQRQRAVYLPAGAEWYDFWTKAKQAGGQYVTVAAPLDKLPIFVRAGTILPQTAPIQHTGEPVEELMLDVYPGAKTTGYLYEDDGRSFAFAGGEFRLTQWEWKNGALRVVKQAGRYASPFQRQQVLVAGQRVG
jgi:alpha-glucosidase